MSGEIPAHRFAPTVRSGDSHVISDDGALRNVDRVGKPRRKRRADKPTEPIVEPGSTEGTSE